jgi:hypothetical protein
MRDPRAVAFSWRRRKGTPDKRSDQGLLRRVGLVRSTLVWQWYNWVIRRHVKRAVGSHRILPLRYEDLASSPESTLDHVIAFLGEQPRTRPQFHSSEVDVLPSHTASGNPNRFNSGRRTIRLDDEWERVMPAWRKAVVTALAFPMIVRLRYPWRA